MRHLRVGSVLIALAFALVPSLSRAGVSIELKNGNTISADECRESNGRLVCYKMGGTFEIEKQDIASVRRSKGESMSGEEEQPPATQENTGEGKGKPDKGALTKDPAVEGKARLDRITQRKRELQPEREKLISEREKLNQELKSSPDWMTVDKFQDLKKRMSALDERINAFNDEVTRLNKEEKTIRDSLQKGSH